MRHLQNSIRSQIRPFSAGFEFLAKRLWPKGYVALREIEPAKKSSNLTLKANFAITSNDFFLIVISSLPIVKHSFFAVDLFLCS